MGWASPKVLTELAVRVVVLALFAVIETKVTDPMFRPSCSGSGRPAPATSPACSPRSVGAG